MIKLRSVGDRSSCGQAKKKKKKKVKQNWVKYIDRLVFGVLVANCFNRKPRSIALEVRPEDDHRKKSKKKKKKSAKKKKITK